MTSTSALFETPSFELEPLKTASSTALSVLRGDCVAPPGIAAAHNETDFENSSSEFVVPLNRDRAEVVDAWQDGVLKEQSEMCDDGKVCLTRHSTTRLVFGATEFESLLFPIT